MTYLPGSSEASFSVPYSFETMRAVGRILIEHERVRAQQAEDTAKFGFLNMTQQIEISVEYERQ